jgi:hypothetical protein
LSNIDLFPDQDSSPPFYADPPVDKDPPYDPWYDNSLPCFPGQSQYAYPKTFPFETVFRILTSVLMHLRSVYQPLILPRILIRILLCYFVLFSKVDTFTTYRRCTFFKQCHGSAFLNCILDIVVKFQCFGPGSRIQCFCDLALVSGMETYPEFEFLNVYGAQILIPKNQFVQPK